MFTFNTVCYVSYILTTFFSLLLLYIFLRISKISLYFNSEKAQKPLNHKKTGLLNQSQLKVGFGLELICNTACDVVRYRSVSTQ